MSKKGRGINISTEEKCFKKASEENHDDFVIKVEGRLRRLDYIVLSSVVTFFGILAAYFLYGTSLVFLSWFITMAIQAFLAAKRLQDADINPGWSVIAFIPFVSILGWLLFICLPGTKGDNQFGKDPRV